MDVFVSCVPVRKLGGEEGESTLKYLHRVPWRGQSAFQILLLDTAVSPSRKKYIKKSRSVVGRSPNKSIGGKRNDYSSKSGVQPIQFDPRQIMFSTRFI